MAVLVCHRNLRPIVDETYGTLFRLLAERLAVFMVRASPRIS